MKCPRCNSEHTRLSWLREFTVAYWCTSCNLGFEFNRHRSRISNTQRVNSPAEATPDAVAAAAN